jgi:hypothetical protein
MELSDSLNSLVDCGGSRGFGMLAIPVRDKVWR